MTDQSQVRGDWVREIIGKYADMVFRVAFTHTKSKADAEDVFQDVFLQMFRSATVFENEEHIKAWLLRVTINISRNMLTSAWNTRIVELPEELPDTERNENENGELSDIVKTLPAKYRTVIHLFYFEEMTITEIAKALKTKEGTVKSQLSRARDLLRKKLKGGYTDV
ncbi:DNA-directed RNA polymerase sigma-70 factor [Clostridia bacterium]|nr:DNA-directed RNA polymerase sigma-70 factor [Clostridia bacterium]